MNEVGYCSRDNSASDNRSQEGGLSMYKEFQTHRIKPNVVHNKQHAIVQS